MIVVPTEFARWREHVDGAPGREWAGSLPALVSGLVARWGLVVESPEPLHGALGIVVLVRRDDLPLALKVSWREQTTENEAVALRAWGGRGAMRLFEAAPEANALLVERLDHTRTLHTLPIREAGEIAGTLIRTLAVPPPPGLSTLASVYAVTAGRLPRWQRELGDPVPRRLLEAAVRHAVELGPAGEQVLIHADLHYGNILAGSREPWSAIDPRPLQGAPEYSVPELMWNRADDLHTDADIRRHLGRLTGAGGLDRGAARGWVIARCVDYWLWGVEKGLTVDPARCERILGALAPPIVESGCGPTAAG